MTIAAALQSFYSSFGLPAYEENSVPDDATFPYVTYDVVTDGWGGNQVSLTASLWYKTDSWVAINAKSEEIRTALKFGGKILPCDAGAIWIMTGTPYAQNMVDPSDDTVKRKYINFIAEYFTL